MTWDVPTADNCPECQETMFKKSGRGYKRPFCVNEKCPNFLPEDQRGYKKKTAEADAAAAVEEKKAATAKKTAAKKAPAKKAPAKKATTAKKTTAKKPAAAKPKTAKE